MAGKDIVATPETAPPPASRKLQKFGPPDEMPEEFGLQAYDSFFMDGVVYTESVRTLLDAFGLSKRSEVVFPFQHIEKKNGEIWRMRIEPLAAQTFDGETIMGHKWVYVQDQPERVGSVQ